MSTSEVAQLREQIDQEFLAMRRGLVGLAAGTSKHEFIQARMNRLGVHIDELAKHVGEEQANSISCQAYIRIVDGA